MQKKILTVINILLIIPFIVLFKMGGNVAIYMLPVWAVMSVINTILAKCAKEVVFYSGIMALFAAIGIWIDAILYFSFVTYDSVGVAVMQLETIIMLLYVAVLTVIEYLVKYLVRRMRGED